MSEIIFLNPSTIPNNVFDIIAESQNTFVMENNVDFSKFLKNPERVKELIDAKKIVVHEVTKSWKQHWINGKYSETIGVKVSENEVTAMLLGSDKLGAILDKNMVAKKDWLKSSATYNRAPEKIFSEIGIPYTESAEKIIDNCSDPAIIHEFKTWNANKKALLHGANFILKSDGTYEKVAKVEA